MKEAEKAIAPLERALALRERGDDPGELAVVRFELARALWETSPEAHERCSRALGTLSYSPSRVSANDSARISA